jgi:hypothetical protein
VLIPWRHPINPSDEFSGAQTNPAKEHCRSGFRQTADFIFEIELSGKPTHWGKRKLKREWLKDSSAAEMDLLCS